MDGDRDVRCTFTVLGIGLANRESRVPEGQ